MSPDNNVMEVTVRFNSEGAERVVDQAGAVEDAMKKVSQLEQKMQDVRQNAAYNTTMFSQDIADQIGFTESAASRLRASSQRTATNARDQQSIASEFQESLRALQLRVGDISSITDAVSDLYSKIGNDLKSNFETAFRAEAPALKKMVRDIASMQVNALGRTSTQEIQTAAKQRTEYTSAVSRLQSQNKSLFNNDVMDAALKAIIQTTVPSYQRGVFGATSDLYNARRVTDLMPKQFGKYISAHSTRANIGKLDDVKQTANELLSQGEINQLMATIKRNPYVLDEALASGLLASKSGSYYRPKSLTRDAVNRFSGQIGKLFTTGAMGMQVHGINDIMSDDARRKIVNKENQALQHAERAAWDLASQFDWLNPYLAADNPINKIQDTSKYTNVGRIDRKPRTTSMQFANYVMGADGKLQLKMKQTRDGVREDPVFVNKSMYQSELSALRGADRFVHNGVNSNEFFVEIPKELADPYTSDARKQQIKEQLTALVGSTQMHNGMKYRATGNTQTHIAFTREDLIDQMEKKNPDFFYNGSSARVFSGVDSQGRDAFAQFGAAMSMRRANRTEGELLNTVFGTDTSNMKVVVADLKKLTGLDGQSFISNKYAHEGFQGRTEGVKGTYSIFDMGALRQKYSNFMDKQGNLVLPGAGVGGADLVIPADTGLIEDMQVVKAKGTYNGLSQEQLNEARTNEVRAHGIYAKTRYTDASTMARWIPSQIASKFVMGDEARQFFMRNLWSEMAALDDPDAVKQLLFSGEDELQRRVRNNTAELASQDAQERIESYRNSLMYHSGNGDLLMPQGSMQYSMLAGWLPDVFNTAKLQAFRKENKIADSVTDEQVKEMAVKAGVITPEQLSWSLADKTGGNEHNVLFAQSAFEQLGIHRNPSVYSGNIIANNRVGDLANIAKTLGMDLNALYVDPKSQLLQKLQGADLDGDTALVYALKHSGQYGDVMRQMLVDTIDNYRHMLQESGMSAEEFERSASAQIKSVRNGDSYDMTNPADFVEYLAATQAAPAGMGLAQRVQINLSQFRNNPIMARAARYAEKHYDVTQNGEMKRNETFVPTMEMWQMAKEGIPFMQMFNFAQKDLEKNELSGGVGVDMDSWTRRRLDKINFASVFSDNAMTTLLGRYWAKKNGADIQAGFDWDKLLAPDENGKYKIAQGENGEYVVDANSAQGKFIARMRDLRAQQARGDFLFFDRGLTNELSMLGVAAYDELIQQNNGNVKTARNLYDSIGGKSLRSLLDFGLTRDVIEANPQLKAMAETAEAMFGEGVWGRGDDAFTQMYNDRVAQLQQQIKDAEQEEAALRQSATQTAATSAAPVQKQTAAMMQNYEYKRMLYEQLQDEYQNQLWFGTEDEYKEEQEKRRREMEEAKRAAEEEKQRAPADNEQIKAAQQKAQAARDALEMLAGGSQNEWKGQLTDFNMQLQDQLRNVRGSAYRNEAKLDNMSAAQIYANMQQGVFASYQAQWQQMKNNAKIPKEALEFTQNLMDQYEQSIPQNIIDRGAEIAKQTMEQWDQVFKPQNEAGRKTQPYKKKLDEMRGWLQVAEDQMQSSTFSKLGEDKQNELRKRASDLRATVGTAEERYRELEANQINYYNERDRILNEQSLLQQNGILLQGASMDRRFDLQRMQSHRPMTMMGRNMQYAIQRHASLYDAYGSALTQSRSADLMVDRYYNDMNNMMLTPEQREQAARNYEAALMQQQNAQMQMDRLNRNPLQGGLFWTKGARERFAQRTETLRSAIIRRDDLRQEGKRISGNLEAARALYREAKGDDKNAMQKEIDRYSREQANNAASVKEADRAVRLLVKPSRVLLCSSVAESS